MTAWKERLFDLVCAVFGGFSIGVLSAGWNEAAIPVAFVGGIITPFYVRRFDWKSRKYRLALYCFLSPIPIHFAVKILYGTHHANLAAIINDYTLIGWSIVFLWLFIRRVSEIKEEDRRTS